MIEGAVQRGIGLDTAFNYHGFGSHQLLAAILGDQISQVEVSTKVGFFPGPSTDGPAEHSLAPDRLRSAVEQSADDLGVPPAVVFLHNPERTLATLPTSVRCGVLEAACTVLAEAVASGLCQAWGIACWEPGSVLSALSEYTGPRPKVALVRAGLTLDAGQLVAVEETLSALGVRASGRWGMSPFSGHARHPVWKSTLLDAFIKPGQQYSTIQAAFRLAFDLPECDRVTVGTDNTAHLDELLHAAGLAVMPNAVARYRELIDLPSEQTTLAARRR